MNKQEFLLLLDKYLEGTASATEKELLFKYFNSYQQSQEWIEEELGDVEKMEYKMLHQLQQLVAREKQKIPVYHRKWVMAAAAVLMIVAAGIWFYPQPKQPKALVQAKPPQTIQASPAVPKGKIILSLANGRVLNLDSCKSGEVARQGAVAISKQPGELVYAGHPIAAVPAFNRLSTARGARFRVVLSDGSKVTLNAATSLRFPASFTATERRVEVDGEAYFEVAKDNLRPFRVVVATPGSKAHGTLVEVLGTHFNVNAYADEKQMCTTLLEGSVKVHNKADSQNVQALAQELRPGQQARVGGSSAIEIGTVDVSEVVAWQQDLFHFAGADSREIMRQLARWYDLDIAYKGQATEKRFTGKISRLMALQDVLEILEQGGLRFEVQGRKITLRS